jgi:hypothetical protein
MDVTFPFSIGQVANHGNRFVMLINALTVKKNWTLLSQPHPEGGAFTAPGVNRPDPNPQPERLPYFRG